MESYYDTEKLRALLTDFYSLTGIRIAIFAPDETEVLACPSTLPEFCALIRTDPKGGEQCRICDRGGCQKAKELRASHIYTCHAGLTESVSPLYFDDVLVGYLLLGHLFPYPNEKEGWGRIKEATEGYAVDKIALRRSAGKLVKAKPSLIESATHLVQALSSYLCLEQMVRPKESELSAKLSDYIDRHYAEPLCASEIAEKLGIGKTKLYEISQELYGRGVLQQVRKRRM